MKIVFIIDQVYLHGGIERVLSIKANYISTHTENEVYVITTEQKQKDPCYHFNSNIIFEDLGINYQRNLSYFNPRNLLKLPRHILKTRQALKLIKPDIVIVCSHSVDTYFIPFINKTIPKVKEFHFSKSIESIHRQKGSKSKKKYFLKFADYVESKYNKLVVLNKDEANYYKTNNVKIIPNPLTFFPDTVSKLCQPIVISAGRIAKVKNFEALIDVWELVYRKNKEWQLYIYGSGEVNYIETLQKKINDKKLSNHIILKGSTDQIQNKMLSSSLFVMTSDNECFPLVLLEAQACGLPVIAFDCPHGPRNIINEQSGILIKPDDIHGFSEAILKTMSNYDLRNYFGKNARLNAKNYGVEAIMKHWLNLFDTLIIPKNN